MYYNMRHLLLSILVVSLVGILMIPNVFAPTFEPDKITLKKYVDRDQLFSINYPSDWWQYSLRDYSEYCKNTETRSNQNPDCKLHWVKFYDKDLSDLNTHAVCVYYKITNTDSPCIKTYLHVVFLESFFLSSSGSSSTVLAQADYNVLQFFKDLNKTNCETAVEFREGYLCSNYKVIDASIVFTEEERKGYLIHTDYTKRHNKAHQYDFSTMTVAPDNEPILVTQTMLYIIEGHDLWRVEAQIEDGYADTYLKPLIESSLSLKLLQASPPPPPLAIPDQKPSIPPRDTVLPQVLVPDDITLQTEEKNGASATFNPQAIDNIDELITPTCNPASGSVFVIGTTEVVCTATDSSGNSSSNSFNVIIEYTGSLIPNWVKNVAGFWHDGSINDASFLEGISYLIQNNIIIVPTTEAGTGGGAVPDWVKNTAGWWANDEIDDDTFVNAITYLIQQGLIQV